MKAIKSRISLYCLNYPLESLPIQIQIVSNTTVFYASSTSHGLQRVISFKKSSQIFDLSMQKCLHVIATSKRKM